MIDFRSDTVTTPTERMRDAMRDAAVGDDVLDEDPTVDRLERKAAEIFGKEDCLFVVSGTMANQIAVLALCQRGDQVIVLDQSHIFNLEVGGLSSTCGVQPRAMPAFEGRIDPDSVEKEIFAADTQRSPTTLLCLENTCDLNRGLPLAPMITNPITQLAHQRGLKTYLDGARIFNASVALDLPVSNLCEDFDVVAACLSKGLACPVGSVLGGTSEFIAAARRMRQRLGGGWRQAGILAAAGIVALEEMIDRLEDDHANAHCLAEGLLSMGFGIDLEQVKTNIVHVGLEHVAFGELEFERRLAEMGIRVKVIGKEQIRMVTHKDILEADIENTLDSIRQVLRAKS